MSSEAPDSRAVDIPIRSLILAVVGGLALYHLSVHILYQVRNLITPIIAALLVAYVLYPIVRQAKRIGVPVSATVAGLFLVLALAIGMLLYSIVPSVRAEILALYEPGRESRTVAAIENVARQLNELGLVSDQAAREAAPAIGEWIKASGQNLLALLGDIAGQTGQFLMIFFFVLTFALLDGDGIYQGTVQMIPNSFFEPGLFILHKSMEMLGNYMRGLVVENAILGAVSVVLLAALCPFTPMTIPVAIAIAIIIALTNVIRVIGPFIGAAIGVLLVMVTNADLWSAAGVIGVCTIVQTLDNTVILPLIMQGQINIHPVICMLGVLAGGMVAGIMGMALAIPVIGCAKIVYRVMSVEMKQV